VTVKAAAEKAATTIVSNVNIYAVKNLLSILFESLEAKHKWQTRVGALALIGSLAKIAPDQLANSLPDVVPTVSQYMSDAKVQVAVSRACPSLLPAVWSSMIAQLFDEWIQCFRCLACGSATVCLFKSSMSCALHCRGWFVSMS
jgi:hypothetical protein